MGAQTCAGILDGGGLAQETKAKPPNQVDTLQYWAGRLEPLIGPPTPQYTTSSPISFQWGASQLVHDFRYPSPPPKKWGHLQRYFVIFREAQWNSTTSGF